MRRARSQAIATLALGAALLAVGCAGESEDDTNGDRGSASSGAAEGAGNKAGPGEGRRADRERDKAGPPPGGAAQLPKMRAAVRECLERHGVELPARGGDRGEAGNVLARINEFRSAAEKCREELPEGLRPGKGSAPQVREWQRRARRAAARQVRRFAEFRACMGRHGFGPEADESGNARPGDVRKAFKRCGPLRPRPAG